MENDAQVEKLMELIKDQEKRLSKLEQTFKTDEKVMKSKTTIKDYIISKNPKKNLQKTLSIGHYLEKFEGFESFNATDLDDGFRRAKQQVPKNINDMVNKNIDKKYMMVAKKKIEGKLAWNLTAKGEEYIESGFQEKQDKK